MSLASLIQQYKGKHSVSEADASSTALPLRFILDHFTSEASVRELAKQCAKPKNAERILGAVNYDDERFCQGTTSELYASLASGIDLKAGREARAIIERGELARKIKLLGIATPKRAMRLSDCEGDFDWSQRFSDKPYLESYRTTKSMPALTIEAFFNFTSAVSSSDIDQYGAFVWALNDLIEAQGIRTRILYVNTSTGSYSGTRSNAIQRTEIELKRADQYILPAQLAAFFKANFFRRVGFAIKAINADLSDATCEYSFGRSVQQDAVRYNNGTLSLSGDASKGATAEVLKSLTELLNARKAI